VSAAEAHPLGPAAARASAATSPKSPSGEARELWKMGIFTGKNGKIPWKNDENCGFHHRILDFTTKKTGEYWELTMKNYGFKQTT